MAIRALAPLAFVRTAVNGEILTVVIKSRRRPGGLIVARRAICRELGSRVIGVGRLVIIRCMATRAGIWRVGVIALVAGSAIIGNGRMRAVKRVIIVVDRKRGRRPAAGRVTTCTIHRQRQRGMAWIRRLVIIRRMTAGTRIRCVGVIAMVAGVAIHRDGGMHARQRIKIIVIER